MKIPVPAIAVPLVVSLLYLFVPGVRRATMDDTENRGCSPCNPRLRSVRCRSLPTGQVVFRHTASKGTRHARSLFADSQPHLCFRRRYVAGPDRFSSFVLVVRAFSGAAWAARVPGATGSEGPPGQIRAELSGLSETDLDLMPGRSAPDCSRIAAMQSSMDARRLLRSRI